MNRPFAVDSSTCARRVPELRELLPFVDQVRRSARKRAFDIQLDQFPVLEVSGRIGDIEFALRAPSRGPRLPAPLRPLDANRAERPEQRFKSLVRDPRPVSRNIHLEVSNGA